MLFLRPATQTLLRRAASTSAIAASARTRCVAPAVSARLLNGTNYLTPNHRRGFATADEASSSPWNNFDMAPPDPIVGLTEVRYALMHPHDVICII